jgi:hypothetical protein
MKKVKRKRSDKFILDFYVTEEDNDSAFRVKVYKDYTDFCEGIELWYRKEHGKDTIFDTNCDGLVWETDKIRHKTIDDKRLRIFAHMFLIDKHLWTSVIAHECLHAALSNEKNVVGYHGGYDTEGQNTEERLAYKQMSYFETVLTKLKEHKLEIIVE